MRISKDQCEIRIFSEKVTNRCKIEISVENIYVYRVMTFIIDSFTMYRDDLYCVTVCYVHSVPVIERCTSNAIFLETEGRELHF
jgi:hypothetical protein